MRNKKFEKAILDKVKKILDGMEYENNFLIRITSDSEELPIIHYECTEAIIPKDGEAE